MLKFLKKNMIGKEITFSFGKEDEMIAIGFIRDVPVYDVKQSNLNKKLFVVNDYINLFFDNYEIHEDYPDILMVYDENICYIEMTKNNEEPWEE